MAPTTRGSGPRVGPAGTRCPLHGQSPRSRRASSSPQQVADHSTHSHALFFSFYRTYAMRAQHLKDTLGRVTCSTGLPAEERVFLAIFFFL